MAITLRQESATGATTKGSSLTYAELDNNFIDLLDNKIQALQVDADTGSVTVGESQSNGVLTVTGGTDITTSVTEDSAGNANITVAFSGSAGIANVVEDTTPQLGGDLDCQGSLIQNPVLEDYAETIHSLGSTDTPTLTVSNGNVQSVTISAGLTLPAFSDAATGQSMTLIVSGSGTCTGTGNHKFAGGNTTLTTESVVSIFYDGTSYYTSIATDFQ